jgi:hypothetical protein
MLGALQAVLACLADADVEVRCYSLATIMHLCVDGTFFFLASCQTRFFPLTIFDRCHQYTGSQARRQFPGSCIGPQQRGGRAALCDRCPGRHLLQRYALLLLCCLGLTAGCVAETRAAALEHDALALAVTASSSADARTRRHAARYPAVVSVFGPLTCRW